MFKRKGIVLITTLAFITVVIMFSVLIAQQGKDTLKSGVGFSDSEQAYLAALSGIEFAKGNLSISKQWGTGTLSHTLKDTDNKIKIESGSNWVKGYVGYNSDDNYSSMFSISFVPNASEFGVCQYPSCNNINNDNDIKASSSNGYHRNIPANCFYIVCKGTAGKAVKHVEAVLSNAGPSVLSSGTMISGNININGSEPSGDTKIDYAETPFLSVLRQDKKSKDDIVTSSGTLTSFNKADINIKNSASGKDIKHLLNLSDKNKGSVVMNADKVLLNGRNMFDEPESGLSCNSNTVFDSDDLQSINSYAAATAGISCDSKNNIPGGTYVYIKDCTKDLKGNKNNTGEWKYIPNTAIQDNGREDASDGNVKVTNNCLIRSQNAADLLNSNYSDYKDPVNTNAISFGKVNKSGKGKDRTITVSDNLTAEGDVNFVVVEKTNSSSEDGSAVSYRYSEDTVDFTIKGKRELGKEEEDPVFMCEGNLFIDGEVTGTGKIFANGNMAFNSGSSLETKAQSGVAVWAGENVDVQPAQSLSNETLETEAGQKALESALKNEYKKEGKTDDEAAYSAAAACTGYVENQTDNNSITSNNEEQPPVNDGNASSLPNLAIVAHNNGLYSLQFPAGIDLTGCSTSQGVNQEVFNNKETYTEIIFNNSSSWPPLVGLTFNVDGQLYSVSIKDYNPGKENNPYFGDFEIQFRKCNADGSDNGGTSVIVVDANASNHVGTKKDSSNVVSSNTGSLNFNLTVGNETYDLSKLNGNMSDVAIVNTSTGNGNTNVDGPGNNSVPPVEKITDTEINNIVTKAIQSNPTKLIGTIYSVKDISINGGNSEFDLLGSLISLNGNLTMENILRASLTYDPDYVPFFKDKGILTNSVFTRVF